MSSKAGTYVRIREQIESAYEAYTKGESGAEERLCAVVRDFALSKSSSSLFDMRELATTAEDLAQEIVILVWSKLSEVRGGVSSFYSWLNRICYTTGARAVNEGLEETGSRVDLTIVDEDGYVDDNPEIYLTTQRPEYQRPLPDFIQGEDLEICWYIRDGYEYPEIAKLMDISEATLRKRISRIKSRVAASKEETKQPKAPAFTGADVSI